MANQFEPKSKDLIDWVSERVNRDRTKLNNLQISQIGKVWITPSQLAAPYTLVAPWANAGAPDFPFQYRLFDKDHLQVRGTLTGGATNTLVTTLLPPFWPDKDIHIIGAVKAAGLYSQVLLSINSVNGQVTANF